MAGLKIDQSIPLFKCHCIYLIKKSGESKRTPKHDWLHSVIHMVLSTCGSPKSGKPIC